VDIAQRPHALGRRSQRRIGDDKAARIRLDPGQVQSQAVGVRAATDRQQKVAAGAAQPARRRRRFDRDAVAGTRR
jgi:hypothetical protein